MARNAVILAGVAVLFGPVAQAQTLEYIGQDQCKVCHNKKAEGEQWAHWKASKHPHALELLKSPEAQAVATKIGLKTPPAESPECLKCHVTAYDVEKKAAPAKIKAADGVQCESCHGPASEHAKAGKIVLFQKDKAAGVDPKANILKQEEKVCTQCHNDTSPTWKADRYTLEDGTKVGFDYKQANAKITHPNPLKKKEGEAAQK